MMVAVRKILSPALALPWLVLALLIGAGASGCRNKPAGGEKTVGFPQSFADLAEEVKRGVVNISTISTIRVPGNPFSQYFGSEGQGRGKGSNPRYFGDTPDLELKRQSLGSGFIYDREGFIITNNHVVEGAEEIKVKLDDGREFTARVVGRDQRTDLALLKISTPAKDLPTLPLGDSDRTRVGDWVLAIGNPFGLEHTVTQGIISATGRAIGAEPYSNFLQTDAPINPGNSGGPLVNLRGEVIGINSSILASGQGIGFAIPSTMARKVIDQLKARGKVVRGWIGLMAQPVTPELAQALGLKEPKGVLVGDLAPGGPAEAAGIKRQDVITAFDGQEINRMDDLPKAAAENPVGKRVEVRIIRGGKPMILTVTVKEWPGP